MGKVTGVMVAAFLTVCLAFSPGAAWALDGEELVDILREEKVITVDQAEKMKKKVQKSREREKTRLEGLLEKRSDH